MRVLIALLLVCSAFAYRENYVKGPRIGPNVPIDFTIAVKQNMMGLRQIDAHFLDRTNPASENYAKWLTIDQIQEITTDHFHTAAVLKWADSENLDAISFGDFVKVSTIVSEVERIFGAEMHVYKNKKTGKSVIRTETGSVPQELGQHIDFVSGLTGFPPNKYGRKSAPQYSDLNWVVPQTIRLNYNVPTNPKATNSKTTQAVVEFGKAAGVSITDLFTFESNCDVPKQNISYIVGPFKFQPINPVDGESSLDIQYIIAGAPGANSAFWTVDGWMYDFTTLVQQRQKLNQAVPWVFSISYGAPEIETCSVAGTISCLQLGGTSKSYVTRTNTEFQKVGLTGISIIVAAGDTGAPDDNNQNCTATNPPINSDWPGSSPYVLTVGGTMLNPEGVLPQSVSPPYCQQKNITCAGTGTEVVSQYPLSGITGGGGFSMYASALSFQTAAVNAWKKAASSVPPASYYNGNGAPYPTVSALAHAYYIQENGKSLQVDGTSCSTPVFAAMVSLLNDNRFNAGKTSLGPLIQLIYTMASACPTCFNDITSGNNAATEQAVCSIQDGFVATAGWDPASGFGSPNFGNILNYIQKLN